MSSTSVPSLIPKSQGDDRSAVGFDPNTLRRVSALAFKHRWRMTFAIIATALAGLSQILIPQLIGHAVDRVHGVLQSVTTSGVSAGENTGLLATVGIMLFAATAFRGAVTMVQNYQGEVVGHLMANELRLAYYAQLQRLAHRYHDETHTGELMTRGILDIEGTRMWVHTGILRLVLLTVLLGGGTVMLLTVDTTLTLVAMAFVPIVGVGASITRLKLRALWYQLQRELGVLTRIMEENLGAIRVVRAYAAEAFELKRFDYISAIALRIYHTRIAIFVASTTTMTFAFFLSMGLVLWVGGERVVAGHISIGELATFLAFMTILQQPVRQISWMVNSVARASTCGARLFEILDLEPEIQDAQDAIELTPETLGTLRFDHVDFRYHQDDNSPLVLKDISFELHPGKTLGIVGPPGSGKSTIAHLIPRFYDVTGGAITIGGHDIRKLKLTSLRAFASTVQQDAYLFTAPIDTNVAYSDPWAERGAIHDATRTAQLQKHIEQLPNAYSTLVGERGVSLSGGQRQRLAIARSILPDAGILILDDATAAVDAGTERDIRTALAQRAHHRATIIIAHRLSSLMHADEILFIDDGRIIERGTHASLLEAKGRYAELHALQTNDSDLAQLEKPS